MMKKHFLTIIGVVFAAAVILVIALCMGGETRDNAAAQVQSIRNTIYERALQCYVIEGVYPDSLEYLEEKYGLTLNRKDYRIVYRPYAQNLPPDVIVIDRKEGHQ